MFNIRLRDLFLIPNLISILRMLLVIPFGFFMKSTDIRETIITLSIAVLIIATDFLDGILARKLNQVSELGKILDPLTDKVILTVIGVLFVIFRHLPIWIMIYIVVRDITVFIVASLLSKKAGKILQSNIWGKLSSFFISISFTLILIFGVNSTISSGVMLFALFMFTFSTIGYIIHFLIPIDNDRGTKKRGIKKRGIMKIAFVVFWTVAIIFTLCGIFGYINMPDPFSVLKIY